MYSPSSYEKRMTINAHDDVGISWKDLSVWSLEKTAQGLFRRQKVEKKRLLNSVSGYARAGSLTAIMGASGAGKTTLLSTVSCRACGYITEGEVLLNGRPIKSKDMIRISGFMPQHDLTVENLTVLEHMQFMAWLKMDVRVSNKQRNLIVESSIMDMGLKKCVNSQLRFLSGGERRKVALAVQLLTDPPVLFCDEPTTGLDSYNASCVVSILSQLAKRGKTVVCTIHQPASGIFESFDEVILMTSGGRVAYQGAIGDALDHFKSLGMVCPKTYNTAELLISRLSVGENFRTEEEVGEICDKFSKSESYTIFEKKFNEVNTADDAHIVPKMDKQFQTLNTWKGPNSITQFRLLFWRHGLSMLRNINQIFVKIFSRLITGFIIAASFRGVIFDQNAVQNLQGFFSDVTINMIIYQTHETLHTFQEEIPILLRETKDNIYSVGPYYVSRTTFVVILCSIETFAYSLIIFWISAFGGGPLSFLFRFYAPILVSGIASTAFGCCLSSVFESMETMSVCMTPLNYITYICSGMFIQLRSLPFYLRWVKYISRMYYGIEAFSILQWTAIDKIPCPHNKDITCLLTADEVLAKYGYNRNNVILDFVGMGAMFVVYHIIGYFGLRSRSKHQAYY